MINRVVLAGRLTRDPELRKTNSGNSVASFTVAIDNRQKNPDGTRGTTFVTCTAWNQSADIIAKFTRKGSMVGVEGRLNQRNYQRRDGTNASVIEVIADGVTLLEPKAAQQAEASTDNNVQEMQDASFDDDNGTNLDGLDLPDDDLPF